MSRNIGILGGGITGLSAAFYLLKKFGPAANVTIFEKSERVGGWIKSIARDDGVYYESGPRSFRPVGLSALSALDLVEELGLDSRVLYVPKSSPVVKNRCIYTKGNLVRLPTEIGAVFRTVPPFEKPLLLAVLKDIFRPRKKLEDDSIYNFVHRRFGLHLADYGIDPLVRGLCAGDARQISVKLTMRQLFEYEQRFGSVVLGTLVRRLFDLATEVDAVQEIPGHKTIGLSSLATTCVKENWALWGLEEGTETLVHGLEDHLLQKGVDIRKNCNLTKVDFKEGKGQVTFDEETSNYDHIISAIPAWELSDLFRSSLDVQNCEIADQLKSIQGIDVLVTNVMYKDPINQEQAFGFLVPSNELRNTPGIEGLLGVVYDSCTFDQRGNTVLTVMSHPTEETVDEVSIRKTVLNYLKVTMGILVEPDDMFISRSSKCIPQYLVGHYEQVVKARKLIEKWKLPLTLAGASYDGVSVNDCIYSGRRSAELLPIELEQLLLAFDPVQPKRQISSE